MACFQEYKIAQKDNHNSRQYQAIIIFLLIYAAQAYQKITPKDLNIIMILSYSRMKKHIYDVTL